MKKNSFLIPAAIIGGAAFYAYKKGYFSNLFKGKTPVKPEEKVDVQKPADTATSKPIVVTKVVNPLTDPNSFESKVAKLQAFLGVAIDGNPGRTEQSQTNTALKNRLGLKFGIVTPSNISQYLTLASNPPQPVQPNKPPVVSNAAVDLASKLMKYLAANKNNSLKLLNDVSANQMQFDQPRGTYIVIGGSKKFYKGDTFDADEIMSRGDGTLGIKLGNTRYFVLSTNFTTNI